MGQAEELGRHLARHAHRLRKPPTEHADGVAVCGADAWHRVRHQQEAIVALAPERQRQHDRVCVHALLTGVAFIVMNALHARLGFTFSAGLFDYLLNLNRATRPLWLLPVGAVYFAVYYGLLGMVIARFDPHTPGPDPRESEIRAAAAAAAALRRVLAEN